MRTEWTMRPATPADTNQIINFITVCLGEGTIPRERQFWEWKHFKNPFGESPVLLAEAQGKIIGLRAFMRWNWRSGNRDLPAVRAVDTATHPDWRGRHIFSNLTLQLKEDVKRQGVSFIFNTPNQSSLPGYLKMGWKRVTKVPLWVRPLKFRGPLFALFKRNSRNVPIQPAPFPHASELLLQTEIDRFLNECVAFEVRYHTVRSMEYVKWRYVDIPGFQYGAKWRRDREAGAVLIFRNRLRKGLHELSVSELLHTPGEKGIELARLLLKELTKESKADYIVATAASDSSEATVLKTSGFFRLKRLGPVFVVHPLNQDSGLGDLAQWSSWRCTIGDLEIF